MRRELRMPDNSLRIGWGMYPELVFFNGAHFAHIVARDEHLRLKRLCTFPVQRR